MPSPITGRSVSVTPVTTVDGRAVYYVVQRGPHRLVVDPTGTILPGNERDPASFPVDVRSVAGMVSEWVRADRRVYRGANARKIAAFLGGGG